MLMQIALSAYRFLLSLVHLYTVPEYIGVVGMFTLVAVVSTRKGRDVGRFFRRPFLTDLAYAFWLPVYTVLIGIPVSLALAELIAARFSFLGLHLLSGAPKVVLISVWLIVNDFFLYWLHRSMHRVPWLWAIHKIHHSQNELNSLTTWRHHWLELLYVSSSALVTSLLVGNPAQLHPIILGVLAASQLTGHSDLDWSYGPIGRLIVSPRFHARHHSTAAEDMNVNFGALFMFWDDLFGTARKTHERVAAYGLAPNDDDVPRSFFLQLFYPLSLLLIKPRRVVRNGTGGQGEGERRRAQIHVRNGSPIS